MQHGPLKHDLLTWTEVFAEERAAILDAGETGARLSALCLSGGGVRSASYCLGVVQALAAAGLLKRFHYLSTVSGGGYIGVWLQTLLREHGVAEVERRLAQGSAASPGREAEEVAWLRRFTNWLTPSGGAFSLDGWAAAGLYLRNVLLNWLVFAPLFLFGALLAVGAQTTFYNLQGPYPDGGGWVRLVPKDDQAKAVGFVHAGLSSLSEQPGTHATVIASVLLVVAACGLVFGTMAAIRGAPGHHAHEPHRAAYLPRETVMRRIGVPMLIWAFCVPIGIAPFWGWVANDGGWTLALPGAFAGLSIAGFLLVLTTKGARPHDYWPNLGWWCIASLAGGTALWSGLALASLLPEDLAAEAVAVAGPAWLVLSSAALSAVHAGLRGSSRSSDGRGRAAEADLDAEWMTRLTVLRLRVTLGWGVFAFGVLSLSRLVYWKPYLASLFPAWVTALIAGPIAAWLGRQAFSQIDALVSGSAKLVTWDLVLRLISLLFALAALAGAGVVMFTSLGHVQDAIVALTGQERCTFVGCNLPAQAALAVVILSLILLADMRIRTNRFSLHGLYRNRLARAFVGAARRQRRRPDPFTGFDPHDNPPLKDFLPKLRHGAGGQRGHRLFAVIGGTLNLTTEHRADWAERKAAPFTFTPLHCGAGHLRRGMGAYRRTGSYAGYGGEGVSVGTAIAVSGAAVSPNWGYHSSAITAFLMTLFNFRLGAWLPNPARTQPSAEKAENATGYQLLLDEMFGSTDDRRKFVYLSDGGHFDNLGLYEMLRRGCRRILVVDATCDPEGHRDDLGTTLRKARIDLGVNIRFSLRGKRRAGFEIGFGHVRYADGSLGMLVVLRPEVTAAAPVDVHTYKASFPDFPNESTTDQWFTESQFESYRALGAQQAEAMVGTRFGTHHRHTLGTGSGFSTTSCVGGESSH